MTRSLLAIVVVASTLAVVTSLGVSAAQPMPTGRISRGPVICSIVGTDGNDVLRGTPADDVICGLNGDDALVGLGGADVVAGGRGNDRIDGGGGRDELDGGRGADLVRGGASADHVEGGHGRDVVSGDGGSDIVQGGRADDFCVATEDGIVGNDVANGGPGFDVFTADDGDLLVDVESSNACLGPPPPRCPRVGAGERSRPRVEALRVVAPEPLGRPGPALPTGRRRGYDALALTAVEC